MLIYIRWEHEIYEYTDQQVECVDFTEKFEAKKRILCFLF